MAGYGGLLSALGGGGGGPQLGPPPGGPAGPPGLGAPPGMPSMPGLPPPPTGIGKMDVGAAGGNPREAASDAVMKLRELKGHFPGAAMQIDGWIQAIVALGKPGGAASLPGANDGADLAGSVPAPVPPPADAGDAE